MGSKETGRLQLSPEGMGLPQLPFPIVNVLPDEASEKRKTESDLLVFVRVTDWVPAMPTG